MEHNYADQPRGYREADLRLRFRMYAKVRFSHDVAYFKQDVLYRLSSVVRKPAFCMCENKGADQLRGYREADQRLCFRYIDSTIPLLSKSEISSF